MNTDSNALMGFPSDPSRSSNSERFSQTQIAKVLVPLSVSICGFMVKLRASG